MRRPKAFLNFIALSKLSLLGAALTTSSILADFILVLGEVFLFESNPYIGIVVYIVFPSLAMLGLALIPIGVYRKAKKLGGKLSDLTTAQRKPLDRMHVVQVVFGLSMLNLVIFGVAGYRGFHFTESKEFCGELCHEVMHPELTTYLRSPHSEISCVECHIGSGAGWFVKSKLSGVRQLFAVASDSFSRPIQTPIHNLRPAREVCEVCHRPGLLHGNRIRVIQRFEPDRENTLTHTVLNLRVGGGDAPGMDAHGIHWHVSQNNEIRYQATDHKREEIVWVELTSDDGERRVWTRSGTFVDEAGIDEESTRLMDCVDCHNRPTHVYLPPDKALDQWMKDGLLDRSIPWIRKISEEVITRKYTSSEAAMDGIAALPGLYRERYPTDWDAHGDKVEATVPVLQEIHSLFVYPEMKIEWNTYPSWIGHPTPQTGACFRCHNGLLRDENGIEITMDCNACHHVLAQEEANPLILRVLEEE